MPVLWLKMHENVQKPPLGGHLAGWRVDGNEMGHSNVALTTSKKRLDAFRGRNTLTDVNSWKTFSGRHYKECLQTARFTMKDKKPGGTFLGCRPAFSVRDCYWMLIETVNERVTVPSVAKMVTVCGPAGTGVKK